MLTRILVPLDGSPLAERILPEVRLLGQMTHAELLPFRAYGTELRSGFEMAPDIVSRRPDAIAYVERLEREFQAQGLRVRGLARLGDAASTILETAAEEGADLIAMMSHGQSGLNRWIFGSVAERVLRAATVPLFVARAFAPECRFQRILVPCDGSRLSREVLPQVAPLARLFGSRVLVLRVIEPQEPREEAEHSLQSVVAQLAAEGVMVAPLLREGDPASEILDVAREHGADLVALSTRGRSGATRWMFGSVTEKVLRAGVTPLFVFPARESSRVLVQAGESCWKE